MKKTYIKPAEKIVAIKTWGVIMTSTKTVSVMSEQYDDDNMTDL